MGLHPYVVRCGRGTLLFTTIFLLGSGAESPIVALSQFVAPRLFTDDGFKGYGQDAATHALVPLPPARPDILSGSDELGGAGVFNSVVGEEYNGNTLQAGNAMLTNSLAQTLLNGQPKSGELLDPSAVSSSMGANDLASLLAKSVGSGAAGGVGGEGTAALMQALTQLGGQTSGDSLTDTLTKNPAETYEWSSDTDPRTTFKKPVGQRTLQQDAGKSLAYVMAYLLPLLESYAGTLHAKTDEATEKALNAGKIPIPQSVFDRKQKLWKSEIEENGGQEPPNEEQPEVFDPCRIWGEPPEWWNVAPDYMASPPGFLSSIEKRQDLEFFQDGGERYAEVASGGRRMKSKRDSGGGSSPPVQFVDKLADDPKEQAANDAAAESPTARASPNAEDAFAGGAKKSKKKRRHVSHGGDSPTLKAVPRGPGPGARVAHDPAMVQRERQENVCMNVPRGDAVVCNALPGCECHMQNGVCSRCVAKKVGAGGVDVDGVETRDGGGHKASEGEQMGQVHEAVKTAKTLFEKFRLARYCYEFAGSLDRDYVSSCQGGKSSEDWLHEQKLKYFAVSDFVDDHDALLAVDPDGKDIIESVKSAKVVFLQVDIMEEPLTAEERREEEGRLWGKEQLGELSTLASEVEANNAALQKLVDRVSSIHGIIGVAEHFRIGTRHSITGGH